MADQISEDVVRHVADLARLSVTDEEVHMFAEQLNVIAGHFADMDELDLDDVEPTTHALPVINVFREDVVRPSLSREAALDQAPVARDGQFMVPKILGEEQ